MIPTFFMGVAAIWSRTYPRTGLFATGMSCFAQVKVKGLSRVPLPPLSTSAFIVIPYFSGSDLVLSFIPV